MSENTSAIYGEQQAGRSAAVRKILSALMRNVHEATFDIAILLEEAKSTGYFRAWGYETLTDYAATELHIRQRKSQYLVRIIQVCRQLGIERKHYEVIGVTKLREITRLNPDDFHFNPVTNINEPMRDHMVQLFADAPGMTTEQVAERVNQLLGLTGEDAIVHWTFTVKRAVKEKIIKVALELARRLLGSAGRDQEGMAVEYSDGAALEVVCADFIVGNQSQEDDNVELTTSTPSIATGDSTVGTTETTPDSSGGSQELPPDNLL